MKSPPHNLEAERAVLGALMLRNEVVPEALGIVAADDFYDVRHRQLYAAALELWPDELIDPVSLFSKTDKKIELAYISEILDGVASAGNIAHFCKIVNAKSVTRQIIQAGQQIVDSGQSEPRDVQEYAASSRQLVSDAGIGAGRERVLTPVSDGLTTIVGDIIDQKPVAGIVPTGFDAIDRISGGIFSDLVTVLAGRPSMGKSALALNISINIAQTGKRVGYFSLEDAREFMMRRLISRVSGVALTPIVHGQVPPSQFPDILSATNVINTMPLLLTEKHHTADQLRQSAWAEHAREPLDMIVIDHLGYTSESGKEYDVISAAMRSIVCMAKELHIAVLLLHQLNRSGGKVAGQDIPTMKELRGSGHIEQDARGVWFIYRPWYYDNSLDPQEYQIIIAKNSHGPTGVAQLRGDMSRMRFRDGTTEGGY